MTKISIYPTISSPQGDDILIGTDIHQSDSTKNFMISDMFAIGLEVSTSKLKIYDPTLFGYGEITLNNDVFTVKGAPTNNRDLLKSSATGFLSFKKNNNDIKFDATATTSNRTYVLPNVNGTIALTSDIPTPKYTVFTALLTQSGGDVPATTYGDEILNAGVTYQIISNPDAYDLTPYGAPNNNVGTYFISNQTTPLAFTISLELLSNTGAPVATVLENTIGNIWFTFLADGSYFINKQDNFDPSKTTILIGPPTWDGGDYYFQSGTDGVGPIYLISKYLPTGLNVNGAFQNTTIEIRIYA